MKIIDALLCSTCDELHTSPRKCPSCGSEAEAFAVARVIKPLTDRRAIEAAPVATNTNRATDEVPYAPAS